MPNLSLHCGSSRADLKRLRAVKTPPSTSTYQAVPCADLRDRVVGVAELQGLEVVDERWGIGRKDQRAFGVLPLCPSEQADGPATDLSMGRAIGLRASHDMSLPIGLCAGGHVFVCANLCFSGDGYVARWLCWSRHITPFRANRPRL